jgi:outer membrane protein TolC
MSFPHKQIIKLLELIVMTQTKALVYTLLVFALLCAASYIAFGQAPKQLSLKEALELTLANNRSIKITSLDVEKSQQGIIIEKSKGLPSVGISGQIDHYFRAPAFFGFGNNSNGSDKITYGRFGGRDQASAALLFTQPLYDASIRPGLQYANLLQRTSNLLASDKKTNISAAVKQTYIFILVLNERIKLQKESLLRNEKALKDAKSLLAQGRALRVDTLRAYTSVKNLEPDLLKLSYAIEVGKQQLKTLTGIDSLQDIELSDSLILPSSSNTLSEEEVYNEAKLYRADLKALELQQQLADQQIKLAAAPMKPFVSLNAQYLLQTQVDKFNYLKSYYPSTPFVGAQVTVPIFNGYRNKAKVKQAKIEKDQSVIRSTNAYEELKSEVKKVVADVQETTARIQTSANVSETAKLSYDITQYRYAKGVASRLELTDAELALTLAQSNYLEAVYDYLSAYIELDRTIGKIEE